MKKISFLALAACAMLGFTSCEKNDTPDPVEGKNLWGDVLRGDDMQLQFYPDHFAFYWEYTFDAVANPEIGLIIEGEFPNARFLSYNVYDDDEQTSFCTQNYSLMDVEIEPDNGYINTFREETTATNQKYTVYVLPTDAPESIVAGKENICWFDADVEKVCTMLRYYIPVGGVNAGVDMPSIKAIDLTTGNEVNAPERVLSGIRGEMELPSAAFTPSPTALFFRAPFSYAYPNGPSEYCYSRNVLWADKNGVTGNGITKSLEYKTLMTSLTEDGTIDSASFITSWDGHFKTDDSTYKLEKEYCDENGLDVSFNYCLSDTSSVNTAIKEIKSDDCSDFIFAIYEGTDHAGHAFGFSSNNPIYKAGFRLNDVLAYRTLNAIENRETYETEDWLIILTSDHGGYGTGHGGPSVQERMVFIIANTLYRTGDH